MSSNSDSSQRHLRYYNRLTDFKGTPNIRDEVYDKGSARKHTRWIYDDSVMEEGTGRFKIHTDSSSPTSEPPSSGQAVFLDGKNNQTARGRKAWDKRQQQLSKPKDFLFVPTAAQPYQYQPLSSSYGSFRLLVLQAAESPEAPLVCRLDEFTLLDKLSFEAISYTWGSEIFGQRLQCVDGTLNITENLAAALRRFRMREASRLLWADAVCINQADDAERGSQVRMMGRIYGQAVRTLVWLGDGSLDSARAVGVLKDTVVTEPDKENCSQPTDHENGARLECVWSLLKRPWFYRRWIVQEVVLSHRVWMFCGDDEIDFDDFARAYSFMSSNMYTIAKAAGINFNLPITEMTTKAGQQSTLRDFDNLQLGIFDLMEKFQDFDCKDPRDRLYALFELPGHSSDGLSISPDYTKSVEQVYTDLALECLSNDFGTVVLKVLHYAGAFHSRGASPSSSTTPSSSLSLPSWVPDWTCRARYHHFWNVRGKGFKAATDKEPCIRLSSQGQQHVLHISGFLLGHVNSCWSSGRLAQGDFGNSEVLQARVDAVYEEACAAQMGIPFALDEVRQEEVFEQLWSERIVFDAGFLGLGPPDTQAGDTVCLFHGAQTPFIIRRCESGDLRVVGDAFVREVMHGGPSSISKHGPYDFSIV